MKEEQVHELLFQALETEQGGQKIYEMAIACAQNDDLREEWQKYLEQTRDHERHVLGVMQAFGLDPQRETPGRKVVRQIGESLLKAMQMAQQSGSPEAAQIVAAECVVLAETKDHQNRSLLSDVGEAMRGDRARAIKDAVARVEDQEDEHLYHTRGWGRELWIESLGMPAVLPPPEEEKQVKTMIGAARAEQARGDML